MTEHQSAPEIVVHRDHDDDWKRIGLVDDYGQKIELSLAQLYRLAEIVQSDEFPLITGLRLPHPDA
jgi:hypothetical protein